LSQFFPLGATTLEAFNSIDDPDEGMLCGGGFGPCPYLQSIAVSGDCKNTYAYTCGCISGGGELDVYRTATSGLCSISISVKDSWGLVGTSTFNVRYDGSTITTSSAAGIAKR